MDFRQKPNRFVSTFSIGLIWLSSVGFAIKPLENNDNLEGLEFIPVVIQASTQVDYGVDQAKLVISPLQVEAIASTLVDNGNSPEQVAQILQTIEEDIDLFDEDQPDTLEDENGTGSNNGIAGQDPEVGAPLIIGGQGQSNGNNSQGQGNGNNGQGLGNGNNGQGNGNNGQGNGNNGQGNGNNGQGNGNKQNIPLANVVNDVIEIVLDEQQGNNGQGQGNGNNGQGQGNGNNGQGQGSGNNGQGQGNSNNGKGQGNSNH